MGGIQNYETRLKNQQNIKRNRRVVNRSYPKGYDVRLNTRSTIHTCREEATSMICSMWVPGKIVPGDKPEHKYQCEGKSRNTELIVQGTVWHGTLLYQQVLNTTVWEQDTIRVYGTVPYIFGENNIILKIHGTYPSRGFIQGMYRQAGKTEQYYVRSITSTVTTYWEHQNMKYGVQILIRQTTRNIGVR